ncbi:MAG: ATP-binding protein [Anaerolineae bacterium]|nr:ATP-binding protein [Anaerolineae bacterium]
MKLAIASGKGGTGKTTIAVSLALSLATENLPAPLLVDCDVEEPNAALFLGPQITEQRNVDHPIPEVDPARCTLCGRCAEVCQYHAIAVIGSQTLVFPELCHSCGSCARQCLAGAIREVSNVIGSLERGTVTPPPDLRKAKEIAFAQGTLNIGEAMAVPVIRQLKRWAIPDDGETNAHDRPIILDAPPGASCPVVETLRGADVVLLVTEPTPFGLHDLQVAVQVARDELNLPVAILINRDSDGYNGVDDYCAAENLPILMRIPLKRSVAEGIANGRSLVTIRPKYQRRFVALWEKLKTMNQES